MTCIACWKVLIDISRWMRRNFWRGVYHLLCCCCFSDRTLKYQIPTHYLVKDDLGSLKEMKGQKEGLEVIVKGQRESLEMLYESPNLLQALDCSGGGSGGGSVGSNPLTSILGKNVYRGSHKMLVRDWLMGKGCPGYLDTDETACSDSSGESDSWGSARSTEGVVGAGEGVGEAGVAGGTGRAGGAGGAGRAGGAGGAHARRGKGLDVAILYFSASWCPPCQKMTPQLKKWYLQYQKKYWKHDVSGGKINHNPTGKMIDVLWIGPGEQTLESYNKYRSNMPWHTTSFGSKQHWFLTKYYQIDSFPTFVLIERDGRVLLRTNCKEGLEDMTDMIK